MLADSACGWANLGRGVFATDEFWPCALLQALAWYTRQDAGGTPIQRLVRLGLLAVGAQLNNRFLHLWKRSCLCV